MSTTLDRVNLDRMNLDRVNPVSANTADVNTLSATERPKGMIDDFFESSAFVRPESSSAVSNPVSPEAEVLITGRNVEIPDHYRVHLGDKLSKLERFDSTIARFDVTLVHEKNRRQQKMCQRVEITASGKGPLVRAEGKAENFYAALESALDKLQGRLRQRSDRRHVHHGMHTPVSVAEATKLAASAEVEIDEWEAKYPPHEPGQIVRVKEHRAQPMSVDEALYEMELVGHDFYLFHDSETDSASVVYRRHAFDYGVIRLK